MAERHSTAVDRYLSTAAALDDVAWRKPIGEDKWSPAQITLHLIQTYEVLLQQLRTGQGLKVQTGWLLRQVLRVAVLGPILWSGKLPPGAKAPRVLLPGATDLTQEDGVARLRAVASEFEAELLARKDEAGLQLTHHFFGSVGALRGLKFVAIHTEHHGRQLPERAVAAGRS